MGEIAEMILHGILCESCGEFIGDGAGYPRRCGAPACRPARQRPQPAPLRAREAARLDRKRQAIARAEKPFVCVSCGKRFRAERGLAQHTSDVHAKRPAVPQ
jgi:hypothetical protein